MTAAAATTVVQVDFKYRPPQKHTVAATPRLPRVVKTLALAHRIEAMIAAGELKDYAEAARVLQLTRPRVTQIAALTLLAPTIQEAILDLPMATGLETVTERQLRPIVAEAGWDTQLQMWSRIHG